MDLKITTESFGQDDQSWLASEHGTDTARSINLDVSTFNSATHYPEGYLKSGYPLKKVAGNKYGLWSNGDVATATVGVVTITGSPTGGTWTFTVGGQTTAGIAHNASAAAVQSAIAALSGVGVGNVTVTGSAGGPYTVTLAKGGTPTVSGASLTGGTTPSASVSVNAPVASPIEGHLFTAVRVRPGATVVVGALFWHGAVVAAKLPTSVNSAGQATARDIRYF